MDRLRRMASQGLGQQQRQRQRMRAQLRAKYLAPFERAMPMRPLLRMWYVGALQQTQMRLGQQINWLEGVLSELKAIHSSLKNSVGAQEVVDAYDTSDISDTPSTNGNGSTSDDTTTSEPAVNTRVLHSIFEVLDSDDMTIDDYPRADVVNDQLEKRGYEPLSKKSINNEYDRWWHEEQKEKRSGDSREHEERDGKEVTQKALFAVFEDMEGHKDDFTEEGDYPLVSKVNERLERKGYRNTTQKQVHKEYRAWKEEEEHEGRHVESKPATSRALNSVFEEMEGKWHEFTDDHRYPLVSKVNERLEKKGYGEVTAKQIHHEYDEWVKEESREGEHPRELKEVTVRALHAVFEDMEGHRSEFTEDHEFPLVAKVNARLEKMGYEPVTQKKLHKEYSEWTESEEHEREHKPGSPKPATSRALDEVFEEMHGHKSEFTDDGKYPLVSKVNERLEASGYKNATQKQIHRQYDLFKKSKSEEEEKEEEPATAGSRRR